MSRISTVVRGPSFGLYFHVSKIRNSSWRAAYGAHSLLLSGDPGSIISVLNTGFREMLQLSIPFEKYNG